MDNIGPIGIFDSGYGGLTVFKEIQERLPQYDYIYLGDNARVPYGTRSFETVYAFTKECVFKLFDLGCNLVILACNTASAKALRSLQQNDLPKGKKILGVIRPTTESINQYTTSKHIGILATTGTILSESYTIEINKFFPDIQVHQHACPMWVPLIENNTMSTPGASYFVQKDIESLLAKSPNIDTIVLACTHYPLLLPIIEQFVPKHISVLTQGKMVAASLDDYLSRHSEVDATCSKHGKTLFYTTDDAATFEEKATLFFSKQITASHISV